MPRPGTLISLIALLAACLLSLPAIASAAVTGLVEDPLEGTAFVPDLGRTSVSIGDDPAIVVETLLVARPPAGWGGCVPLATGVCIPAQMSVSWLFDHSPGGSPEEGGADAKVVATPSQGTTTWQSARWDRYNARWVNGAVPTGATDIAGVRWSMMAIELGLPPVGAGPDATVAVRVVARFRGLGADGAPVEATDEAGPLTLPLRSLPPVPSPADALRPPPAASPAPASAQQPRSPGSLPAARTPAARRLVLTCRSARARVVKLDRRIATLKRVVRRSSAAPRRRAARAELKRLRPQRFKARSRARGACAKASPSPAR